MARTELDLNPVDFITIGTIGPKGKRIFHLQAGYQDQIITFIIEKEQAWALSEAINEFIEDLSKKSATEILIHIDAWDMELREPIEPLFRISQMGLAYDETQNMIVLIAQEIQEQESDEEPGVVRLWCTQDQMRALSIHASETVKAGRADPKQNGHIIYYWT